MRTIERGVLGLVSLIVDVEQVNNLFKLCWVHSCAHCFLRGVFLLSKAHSAEVTCWIQRQLRIPQKTTDSLKWGKSSNAAIPGDINIDTP